MTVTKSKRIFYFGYEEFWKSYSKEVIDAVEVDIKYSGYISRQMEQRVTLTFCAFFLKASG